MALVFGHVQKDALVVEGVIEKDPTSDFRMRVAHDTSGGGKQAQTRIEVLERGCLTLRGPHLNVPVTKLRMKPITGRRHQLRCAHSRIRGTHMHFGGRAVNIVHRCLQARRHPFLNASSI